MLIATLLLFGCRGQNPVFYRQIQHIEYFSSDFGGLRDQGREAAERGVLGEARGTPFENGTFRGSRHSPVLVKNM